MAAVYSNSYMPGQNRYLKLTDHEKTIVAGLPNILESYHYVGSEKAVAQMRTNGAKVFLDSGAFSAHTLGATIDVRAYCRYIQQNKDVVRVEDSTLLASVLDGIGDPLKTWENQVAMEKAGVVPLPCFHYGEDERYLEWYVAHYPYITLGGMVPISTPDLFLWLDRIWAKYLTSGSGTPKCKVHGFGVTSISIMERYPWFSCDSSSWIQTAAFGSVVIPGLGPVTVSTTSPSRYQMGRHVTTLAPLERESVEARFAACGFNLDRLSTVYESRAAFNLRSYSGLMEGRAQTAFQNVKLELFH